MKRAEFICGIIETASFIYLLGAVGGYESGLADTVQLNTGLFVALAVFCAAAAYKKIRRRRKKDA